MDKRINLINTLKRHLNKIVIREEEKYSSSYQSSEIQLTNFSKIQALMLRENILLGLAINENSLKKSEIYSEVSESEGLNFHVYPLKRKMIEVTRKEFVEEETKEARRTYPSIP